MKKIGIVTINDNSNYGNRLQNYALEKLIRKQNFDVETIKNKSVYNNLYKKNNIYYKLIIKNFFIWIKHIFDKRDRCFKKFNKNIKFSNFYFFNWNKGLSARYDYFIVGSDQVWNPTIKRLTDFEILKFARPEQRIAFSASFGINKLPNKYNEKVSKELKQFKAISVREEVGKEIVKGLTGRKDIEVLLDPTMLLTLEDWKKVIKEPEKKIAKKYILIYFLGTISEKRKKEIERIAELNECQVINILDKEDQFYDSGPGEFLYLEKNAFLICTDSFHSSVFAILFHRPFVVFKREDKEENMNSRLETLLQKFNLEECWFNEIITKKQLECNYTNVDKVLNTERKKAEKFLKESII